MQVRFGYVAMSVKLEDCSPSKTITVKNFEKIGDKEAKLSKLRRITKENLENCTRLLYYNKANKIHLFRFTSKLVPLVTHPLTEGWDYISDFREEFQKIGDIVLDSQMRVSSHPDHYTLINSLKPEVLEASLKDLNFHNEVFKAMGLHNSEMIMHIGGMYGSKEKSIARFKENFQLLPEGIKHRLRLENDDKCFSASDVLGVCDELGIPMVLDVHHHRCLNDGRTLVEMLPRVFETWGDKLPKVHFSSPKSEKNCRAHADDIDADAFYGFLLLAKEINHDFDVMVEAKNKDLALFKLIDDLQSKTGVTLVEEATIRV